ncbi:putative Protein Skeletor, isoforms B/C [Hypsibius exemplaris]|uniref:Uncharacterized protein n=1 Tax=Hypsibius exemplaris TaxID=2072580 RepID=A0A1W0WMM1_HYPEX|nr:putative Protein Skeletor, isoforms B/C [Hypsibius exemplaris]
MPRVQLFFLQFLFIMLQYECGAGSPFTTTSGSTTGSDRPYKGRLIGQLQTLKKKSSSPSEGASFVISGTIYAVDDRLLYVDKFTFDGGVQGLFIWGVSSDPRSLREDTFIIPWSQDCFSAPNCPSLPAIWEENMLIALPRNISLLTVTEITIGIRNTAVIYPELQERFASAIIPPGFIAPRPYVLPSQLGHAVMTAGTSSGPITVQDSRRILLERVTYDGTGSDAYFWVDRSPEPTKSGFKVAPNQDETPPLPLSRLPRENDTQYDALLNLRRAFRPVTGSIQSLTVFELKSVAIYDRNYGTVYGDAPFNGTALKGIIPPALDDLTVQRISNKAATLIRDLNYQIGMDNDITALPCGGGSNGPRPTFPRASSRIQLELANDMQSDGPHFQQQLRSVADAWNHLSEFTNHTELKPPTLTAAPSRLLRNVWNCEILDDLFEVQWKVHGGSFVTFTLSAPLSALPDRAFSYMAFGISGSKARSEMIGADVTAGFLTPPSRVVLSDLILGGQAKCQRDNPKLDAVCPRSLLNGKQASKLFGGGGLKDGKISFSFRRPVERQDILGKDIPLDGPTFVVWAIGPMNQSTELPEYHTAHTKKSVMLDFGRTAFNNCTQHAATATPSSVDNTSPFHPLNDLLLFEKNNIPSTSTTITPSLNDTSTASFLTSSRSLS